MAWEDLAEHTGALVIIAGFLAALGIGETLRRLSRIERKQDEQVQTHAECRQSLMSKDDFKAWFDDWKLGRSDIWNVIDHHKHDLDGKVTRL